MVAFILSPKNSGLSAMRERAFEFLKNTDKGRIIELRGEDIPLMVEEYSAMGKKVVGLTGEDLLREYCLGKNITAPEIAGRVEWKDPAAMFGKPTLCLLGPEGKTGTGIPKNATICISSKYRNIASKYLKKFEKAGYALRKIYVNGCVETNCTEGVADAVIDIVYTGSSMKKFGLKVLDRICESGIVILAGNGYAGAWPGSRAGSQDAAKPGKMQKGPCE